MLLGLVGWMIYVSDNTNSRPPLARRAWPWCEVVTIVATNTPLVHIGAELRLQWAAVIHMATIYLVGAAGQRNLGDELIAAAWLRQIAAWFPRDNIVLDCMSVPIARDLFGDQNQKITFQDNIWRTYWRGCFDNPFLGMQDGVLQAAREQADDWAKRYPDIRGIILVGGGYLTSHFARSVELITTVNVFSAATGAPVYASGLGTYPLEGADLDLFVKGTKDWRAVDFRCRASYLQVLAACGEQSRELSLTCDDYIGFEKGKGTAKNHRSAPRIVFAIHAPHLEQKPFRISLNKFLRTNVNLYDRIVVGHWHCRAPDKHDVGLVLHHWLDARLHSRCELSSLEDALFDFDFQPNDLVVTSLFHVHVNAVVCGCRGLVICDPANEYYRAKHQSLVEMGSGCRLFWDGDEWWGGLRLTDLPISALAPSANAGKQAFWSHLRAQMNEK